ncbi:MAG: response regulator [Desulfobacterales bacterium]|nr:response regulator [Desulfobacterales bacterium]
MSEKFIMVVDDDPDLVEAVSMKLESKKFRVAKAYDGEEAMEKLKGEKPDLVILDVMMPRKNGWVVCDEIKSNDATKNIVVVMLTAVGDAVQSTSYTHHDGKTTLADDYVPKPIDMDQLMEIVDDHLGA